MCFSTVSCRAQASAWESRADQTSGVVMSVTRGGIRARTPLRLRSGRAGIPGGRRAAARRCDAPAPTRCPILPPEVRAQLFEPGVSTKPGGWGIGLALARRIVEQQHGGRLIFRPGPTGDGAEFVLEFPLVSPT